MDFLFSLCKGKAKDLYSSSFSFVRALQLRAGQSLDQSQSPEPHRQLSFLLPLILLINQIPLQNLSHCSMKIPL